MNKAEIALVNSPPRRWLQRFYEAQVLPRFGGRSLPGARALEIGCGSGYGTQLMLELFGAASVDAVDLDPAMIKRARRRLASCGDRVRLARGSATDLRAALDADDGGYDAVFDFGIVHHIPGWRSAIAEVTRVLTPGGRFYFEEVTAHALARPSTSGCSTTPQRTGSPPSSSSTNWSTTGRLAVLGSITRIRGDYLLGVAAKPVTARSDG